MVVTVYGTVHTMDISTFSRDELAFVNRESPEFLKVWLVLTALFWRFQCLQLKDLTTYARGPFFGAPQADGSTAMYIANVAKEVLYITSYRCASDVRQSQTSRSQSIGPGKRGFSWRSGDPKALIFD